MSGQQKPSPEQSLMYLSELVSEYMKTLPKPVRVPVTHAVNASIEVLQAVIAPEEKSKK